MNKLAFVFAGQGSQYPGMGLDYIQANQEFKKKVKLASTILGYDVEQVLSSPNGEINDTKYTQPLILLSSIFAYESLIIETGIKPEAHLGFSLGEYTALYASGLFTLEDILKIIKKRSEFMKEEADLRPGKMAAILGLPSAQVDDICKEASDQGIVVSANYNSPVQVVISGEEEAVHRALELAKIQGAKRVMPLNVSGAFHSPLMNEAGTKLRSYLNSFSPLELHTPIYMNTTAKPLVKEHLFTEMEKQIQTSVYFEQSIHQMVLDGFTHFIEIGPGTVLSGLIKKINPNLEVSHIDKLADLESLKGWLKTYEFIQ
jgi:[acyl-carrier-protein] S-malonyltransferase